MNIKFSVIVVCYNAGKKLEDTVNSILKQTYQEYEVLVKDGGSTDGSLSALPKDDRIYLKSCKDKGIYDAMNQAIAFAKGDYYLFLNCGDSFYHNEVLGTTAKKIADSARNQKSFLYYGDTYNEREQSIIYMNKKITPFTCYRHIPCHQACFYAKELFEERQYDISYVVRADYEHFLWSYFCKQAHPQYLGIVVANYEGGGFSESKKNRKQDLDEHRSITKKYLSYNQLFQYKVFMALSFVPLRRFISRQKSLAKIYNGIKKVLYRS